MVFAGVAHYIRTYPVTFWATVGVSAYIWKASMVATMYQKFYKDYDSQRIKEMQDLK